MPIIPFTSIDADIESAGGKGANLGRLTRAGFPVPRGFIISTGAYRSYVAENHLEDMIAASISVIIPDDPGQLELASSQIRTAFSDGQMPPETEAAILSAYMEFDGIPVAVRSSATAEDLPELSFAGQQDTVLNVTSKDDLLQAVVKCWSSLWTGRAIGYRARNAIDHHEAALAVVVQEMVQSEVSGVLFTANPLTGALSESVIDATFGLGEALVSGQVEPDHFLADTQSGTIVSLTPGGKRISTRSMEGGGVETVQEQASAQPTLSAQEVTQLVALGQRVQNEYGLPQDIEWAIADGAIHLLQSRPITSLFPVPEVSFDPLLVWVSFGSIQGLVGPITPLGRDVIKHIVTGAGALFGLKVNPDEVKVFAPAGERIWVKFSDVIRNPIGIRILLPTLNFIEPSSRQIINTLLGDPNIGAGKGKIKLSTLARLAGFGLPLAARMVRITLRPDTARADFDASIDSYIEAAHITPGTDRFEHLTNIVTFIRQRIGSFFALALPIFVPMFGPSMGALNLLYKIAGDNRVLALKVTRSLPRNVTTEMDLALWETAVKIRRNDEAAEVFHTSEAAALACDYLNENLPAAAQTAIAGFMEQYGMRGLGEIDIGQPRWRDDPTPVMNTLQSYLSRDPESGLDAQFARGEGAAQVAIEQLAVEARRQHGGWLKEKIVRAAARRIRLLMGARESPKFFMIRLMGIARPALLEVGKEFVAAGTISRPDDLFYLLIPELEALSRNEPRDWQALVAGRRLAYQRELRRRQIPRVLVSDGRAFYEGLGAQTDSADLITGSPVSPGVVEGIVHVVLDPHGARLDVGEILVCPGTDPAWTPLMMAASGLITEVGGMMTHGSVVARELGIPAVVGVHQATVRLKDGQRIQLDGTTGKIVMMRS